MAFWSVVNDEDFEAENRTEGGLKRWFNEYCDWCWGHGYGNCDRCRKYYKHLLYRVKMREFKERRAREAEHEQVPMA